MSVEFNENRPVDYNYPQNKGGLTSSLIKMGLVKDEAGAKKAMLLIAVICFALSIYFFTSI